MGLSVTILADQLGWHSQDLMRAVGERGGSACVASWRRLVWHCSDETGQRVSTQLLDAANQPGAEHVLLPPCPRERVIFVRCMPAGTLEQVIHRLDALHTCVEHGVPVLNPPRCLELSIDKAFSLAKLQRAGLPVPATAMAESADDALALLPHVGLPVVVKPLFGSQGRGIWLIRQVDEAERLFPMLERLGAVIYLQRYVPDAQADVRVLVLGGRILAAVRRKHPRDWRHNAARGSQLVPFDLDPAGGEVALEAARVLGAQLAGVDLLYDRHGNVFVLEVNAVPGWRATSRATGIDVAAAIAEYLESIVATGREV